MPLGRTFLLAALGLCVASVGASFIACTPGPPGNVPIVKHDLSGEDFSGFDYAQPILDLTGADFTGADLSGADLTGQPRMWTDVTPSGITTDFYSVWSDGSNVVAVGAGPILFKSTGGGAFIADASTKPTIPASFNLLSVNGIAPGPPTNPLYAVGKFGKIWSYAGDIGAGTGTWSEETSGSTTLSIFGVWVAPDAVAFAAGRGNYAAKRSGSSTWTALTGITGDALNISGTKAGGYSIYAVGAGGKIWYSTGAAFAAQTSGVTTDLEGVYALSATDIYAVGLTGVILHSTGSGDWTQQSSSTGSDLYAIGGPSADELYAVGAGGTVMKKIGASTTLWTHETLPSTTEMRAFNGVWGNASAIYIVGQAGAILKK